MIRVTFAIDPPFLGGAEVYVARLATGLDRRDFAVSLVMHPSADHALGEWARDLSGQGIDVQTVPMRLPFHPADAIRVHRVFAELAPDIVHVNMPGPYSGQTALLAPIATLATFLTVISMAALGLGVDIRTVAKAGGPVTATVVLSLVLLGAISFALLFAIGLS